MEGERYVNIELVREISIRIERERLIVIDIVRVR